MVRFAYYLAAIGSPNLDKKRTILLNNLKILHEQLKQKIDLFICDYSCEFVLDYTCKQYIDNCYIFHRKGILSQLWLQNHHNYKLVKYDYILFVLDDINISQLSIKQLIQNKIKYNVQFISPMVTNATHPYMFNKPTNNALFAYTNQLEYYCYLLTPIDFFTYISLQEFDNPYLWGIDSLYTYFNITTGLDYTNIVDHCIKERCYQNKRAKKDMLNYIGKKGFTSYEQIIQLYPPIISIICNTNNHS